MSSNGTYVRAAHIGTLSVKTKTLPDTYAGARVDQSAGARVDQSVGARVGHNAGARVGHTAEETIKDKPKKRKLNKDGSVCMQGKGKKHCKCGFHALSNRTGKCPSCGSRTDWIKAARCHTTGGARSLCTKRAKTKRNCVTPNTVMKSKNPTIMGQGDDTCPFSAAGCESPYASASSLDEIFELCGRQDAIEAELAAKEQTLKRFRKNLNEERDAITGIKDKLKVKESELREREAKIVADAESLTKREAEIHARTENIAKREAEIHARTEKTAKRRAKRKAMKKSKRIANEIAYNTAMSIWSHAIGDENEALASIAIGDDSSWPHFEEKELAIETFPFTDENVV